MKKVQGHGINDMPYGWTVENEWNKKIYREWKDMLRRCYDKNFHKSKKGKTYIGCVVCERWLKLSNFVEDVELIDGFDKERILNGELELDKDKKNGTENKLYSLELCTWLSRFENRSLAGLKNKGKQLSEESKRKISEAKQGENHPMYGKCHSEETKQKISKNNGMKGKLGSNNPNSKKVAQYDKATDELIKIWDSTMDVHRELGINQGNISKCCKGKLKSAGGYVWRYLEDE